MYHGKVGIALNTGHTWPRDPNNPSDVIAADRSYQFGFGWFAHPLFSKDGGYPKVMVDRVASNSAKEGRRKSRLPSFSPVELEQVRGSSDFLGINYYTSGYAFDGDEQTSWIGEPSRWRDQNTYGYGNDDWPVAASGWLRSVPEGLRELLK